MTADISTLERPHSGVFVWTLGADTYPEAAEMERVRQTLVEKFGTDVDLIVVAAGDSLEAVPEEQMRQIGWVRA